MNVCMQAWNLGLPLELELQAVRGAGDTGAATHRGSPERPKHYFSH